MGVFVAALIELSACGSALPEPRLEDTTSVAGSQAVSLDELRRGRQAVVAHCAGCHAIRTPDSLPARDWPAVVDNMRNQQHVQLSDSEAAAIVAYLSTMASKTAR
jgi:mono/diheme cytochrome c family protein